MWYLKRHIKSKLSWTSTLKPPLPPCTKLLPQVKTPRHVIRNGAPLRHGCWKSTNKKASKKSRAPDFNHHLTTPPRYMSATTSTPNPVPAPYVRPPKNTRKEQKIKKTSTEMSQRACTPHHQHQPAIGACERQLFNKLCGTVVSRQVFICSHSLIAHWTPNDFILADVARNLYEACSIDDISRGSKSYPFWAS